MAGGVDWDAPFVDIFQSPYSTAPKAEDLEVGVSGAKLPRLSLI
jgi:hypothetical protein